MPGFKLYRDQTAPTGVVLVPGPGRTEVAAVEQLPEWRVEVHRFWSTDAAVAFAQGVALGGGNRVSTHRSPGSDMRSHVVVAFFSDDRPATDDLWEAVQVVEHRASGEDAAVISQHLKERIALDNEQSAARRAHAAPLMAALEQDGVSAQYDGNTGIAVRCAAPGKDPDGWDASCSVRPDGPLWVVEASMDFDVGLEQDLDPRIVQAIEAEGMALDTAGRSFSFPAVAVSEVAPLVRRAGAAWDRITAAVHEIRKERLAAAEALKKRQQRERAGARAKQRRAASR